jgi:hypothetical protein
MQFIGKIEGVGSFFLPFLHCGEPSKHKHGMKPALSALHTYDHELSHNNAANAPGAPLPDVERAPAAHVTLPLARGGCVPPRGRTAACSALWR